MRSGRLPIRLTSARPRADRPRPRSVAPKSVDPLRWANPGRPQNVCWHRPARIRRHIRSTHCLVTGISCESGCHPRVFRLPATPQILALPLAKTGSCRSAHPPAGSSPVFQPQLGSRFGSPRTRVELRCLNPSQVMGVPGDQYLTGWPASAVRRLTSGRSTPRAAVRVRSVDSPTPEDQLPRLRDVAGRQ